VLATPGLTALRDEAEARAMLVDDALRAVEIVRGAEGSIVDVGAGGGSPGIPLAHALPERELTLLEASRRKCDFLERWAPPNARVVWGRAEEQEADGYGVALAKALAQPPVAAELCLPLVRPGGIAVLWLGPSADLSIVGRVSALLGGDVPEERGGLVVLRKLAPTPPGFPRRAGMPKKRPLG
jgi:16S rRNA (guanine527-N7)-methyltransferase